MTIFSGALAGQTLAGTTLAGTTLGGITLAGTTLHETAGSTAPYWCQSDTYDEKCEWQKKIQSWASLTFSSPKDICDQDKYLSAPYCEEAEKMGKWPYYSSGLQTSGNTPDCKRHGDGWWWSDSDGACIPPLQQKGSVPDCKRHGTGYTWSDAKGECVPPAPQISMASNSGMIIGAVVVLGVVAALVASQKKGRYS